MIKQSITINKIASSHRLGSVFHDLLVARVYWLSNRPLNTINLAIT